MATVCAPAAAGCEPIAPYLRDTCAAGGGKSGVEQAVALDVTGVRDLRVAYVGYVDSEDGGNIGGGDEQLTSEGGAMVRVFYTDANGEAREWYHGMCMKPTSGLDVNFQRVPDNEWTEFESQDLVKLDPAPASIDAIRFYGFGRGFDAMFDDCDLIIRAYK